MKTGKSLTDLAVEIQRQNAAKQDYIVPTPKVSMYADGLYTGLALDSETDFGITDIAHDQIAGFTKIDKRYYDRMRMEAPDLLAQNVNHWFTEKPDNRMLRTLDGNARALLSPRYRPLDNAPMAEVIFEEVSKFNGSLIPVSMEITEKKLYLKFIYPELQGEVKVGDVVRAGVMAGTSEVGFGAIFVKPFIERLKCTNGMIMEDGSFRRTHIGRAFEEMEEAYAIYADETRKADDRAFFMKLRDVFRAALNEDIFFRNVENLKESTTRKIEGSVLGAVQVLSNQYAFNENEKGSILNWLIREGDLTQYGLAQAVTRTAEDLDSYDRATEFEKIGGEVIMMPAPSWKAIAHATDADGAPKKRGRKPKNAIINVSAA